MTPSSTAQIRAVIFDLDGTLIDTLDDLTTAINHALAGLGYPLRRREEIRGFIGDGARELVARALPADGPLVADGTDGIAVDVVLGRFLDYYKSHLIVRTAPYSGIPALLDQLVSRGLTIAVLSNKPDPATRAIVAQLLGRWHFAAVRGEMDGVPRKPDPAAAIAMAAAIGVAPNHTLLVGDSGHDIETARRAGMVPVGVEWGFRDRAELLAHGARAVIANPAQLLALVDDHAS